MISRAVPALLALLLLSASARAAAVDDVSKGLLADGGYELRADGKYWDKIAEAPVADEDMPYLLSRLASARRLKALLEIHNIINRYDAERSISAEDREAVRGLVRGNWLFFGEVPRNDFRSYFSVEELATLDAIPSRFESMGPVTLTDPPVSVTATAPPSITATAPPAPAAAPPASITATAPAASPAPVAPSAVPAAVSAAAAPVAAVAAAQVHVFAAEAAAPPPAPPAPAPAAIAPAASTAPAVELGTLRAWTPPAVSSAKAAAAPPAPVPAPAAAPAVAIPPPPPPAPKPAEIGDAEYEKFVAEGPYSKEGRGLLALIGKRAPDFCRPLLRRTVVGAMPQIVLDGARTGASLRAGIVRDPADAQAPPVVALSPGPVFVEVKAGLFGSRQAVLLPESPKAWSDLGLPRPSLDAFHADAPASARSGDWGAVRAYADGSRRGSYSPEEQAGELLEQILLIGLSREGLDASAYAARRWARTARLMLSLRLKDEMRQDAFLDPDRRAELRDWLERPDEAQDVTAAVWSGSRVGLLDPRRGPPEAARGFEASARGDCARAALEDALVAAARRRAGVVGTLESLAGAGVVDDAAAKAAESVAENAEAAERKSLLAAPPACAPAEASRDEGLRKSALLAAESSRAERLLRERAAGIDSGHDL